MADLHAFAGGNLLNSVRVSATHSSVMSWMDAEVDKGKMPGGSAYVLSCRSGIPDGSACVLGCRSGMPGGSGCVLGCPRRTTGGFSFVLDWLTKIAGGNPRLL